MNEPVTAYGSEYDADTLLRGVKKGSDTEKLNTSVLRQARPLAL